jgi:predicted DNA-binding transcriptional regulator YafY
MAKKKSTRPAEPARPAVTAERFARLVRLVRAVGKKGQSREQLTKQLALDVRGFYRDLELLRAVGVTVLLSEGIYRLKDSVEEVIPLLPFPDPHLTLGEARQLARGRSRLHVMLQDQIAALLK